MFEVAVYGAGIAGLSAAHELAELGHRVSVYEALAGAGGFFRSDRRASDGLPSEYSWHGFGPWYCNTYDLLQRIPAPSGDGSLYDRILSRPINFGIFPDTAPAHFYDRGLRSVPTMFRMNWREFFAWSVLMLATWSAGRRRQADYARRSAAEAWSRILGPTAQRTWRACFGPWIGSDWTRCSLHTCGDFFCKQLTTPEKHRHRQDAAGPAWQHGAGDGWLLLTGPSSEVWFQPWVAALQQRGVTFHYQTRLTRLETAGGRVSQAEVCDASGARRFVQADQHILAINPFIMAEVVAQSPDLQEVPELAGFAALVQDGPHNQISFRLAFPEPVAFPRQRTAAVISDSEFNITLFAQEQAWDAGRPLGDGVCSLWTGTCCVSRVPGRRHGRAAERCTLAEFKEEVWTQILACGALDEQVRAANQGRGLAELAAPEIEVWPEWDFSVKGLRQEQPKWVSSMTTAPHRPPAGTAIGNLHLAGAHTSTQADVWSIEGAVESGRRAAQRIDARVRVLPQRRPRLLRLLGRIDDLLHLLRAPHVLWCLAMLLVAASAAGVWLAWTAIRNI